MSDTFTAEQREQRARRPKRFKAWKKRFYRINVRCGDKGVWPDEVQARVGGMVSLEERKNARQLWVYNCKKCKRWHLTSHNLGPRWAVMPEVKKA